ncbi:MAG: hypothetical protein QF477_14020 [SAR202 cluster bacterium]|jgi:ABC-2 type transport system permease protein|nr:hypothetical protein [SAR202 cluster bacterium]MDP6800711.1 hypothetical protein [SAR202 cluster bacterium]
MGTVLGLSFRQLGGRWRLTIIFLLVALQIGLAITVKVLTGEEEDFVEGFINIMLDGLLVGAVLPLVTMALATASFGNEMDDRTLSYIVLKPLARWRIALPKLLASIVIAGPILALSGAFSTVLGLDADVQTAAAVGVGLFVGVAAYASIFTWLGLRSSRALAFALVYVLLWEGLISSFIHGVDYLSVRGYTLAIMHGMDTEALTVLEVRTIEFPAAAGGAALAIVAFFWLTVRRLQRMDVP